MNDHPNHPAPAAAAAPADERGPAIERFVVWGLVIAGIALRAWYLWDFSGSPLFALTQP